jgi:uncharacterized spore protein YtfJ
MTVDDVKSSALRSIEDGPVEQLIERLAERVGARAGVQAVFGEPIRSGDTVVVPVVRVRWGFGGGGGPSAVEQAAGSGGGGGAASDPAGYLVIRDNEVQFHPISRPWSSPQSILAGAVAGAIVLRALARLVR